MGNLERKKSGRRGTGEKEGAPAIKAPIGSILRSLAAAKFRLVNQTIEWLRGVIIAAVSRWRPKWTCCQKL